MKNNIFTTNSFSQTQNLAKDFIKTNKGRILALYGDLGSGKTTFVQGLGKGLGIKKRMTSPTFLIIKSYDIDNKKIKEKYFYHIDLYRIKSNDDVLGLELDEIINNKQNIVVIEWPEKLKKILPKNVINVHFEYLSINKRRIEFK